MLSNIKLPALTLGLSFLVSSVSALPTAQPIADILEAPLNVTEAFTHDALHNHEKRDGFAVTGYNDGHTYPRLEIRQLVFQKPNQWNLLLLAMEAFKKLPESQQLSYYQIAGIHGVPRVNWDGVGPCSSCADADGYCTHDIAQFPTWHRVYLALFEQQFMSLVNQIANQFSTQGSPSPRDYMVGAASTMRFPFWDWAARANPSVHNGDNMPGVISDRFISVNRPDGSSQQIINPLFRYDFQDTSRLGDLVYSPFNTWKVTLRHPGDDSSTASTNIPDVISTLNGARSGLQSSVFNLLTACDNYQAFSNDDSGSASAQCGNSLEAIHNNIHTLTGGVNGNLVTGHMRYLPLAAFDPVFWFHHANVDRIFAMWQALHPNSWGFNQNAPHRTWTISSGQHLDTSSPLTPFHKDTNGNFWNSDDVRDHTRFHYTYPEFIDGANAKAGRNPQPDINSYVNKLYGQGATATAGSSKRTAAPSPAQAFDVVPTDAPVAPLAQLGDAVKDLLKTPFIALNGSSFEYVANIHYPRYALNGSYNIFMFNGAPASEDSSTWFDDASKIGFVGVVSMPGMSDANVTASSSIPLTDYLTNAVHEGCISDMSMPTVSQYLTKQLTWRVAAPDGCSLNPADVPGYEVGVFASTTSPIASIFDLPSWSEFIEMSEVTCEKSGGAKWDGSIFSTHRSQRASAAASS